MFNNCVPTFVSTEHLNEQEITTIHKSSKKTDVYISQPCLSTKEYFLLFQAPLLFGLFCYFWVLRVFNTESQSS